MKSIKFLFSLAMLLLVSQFAVAQQTNNGKAIGKPDRVQEMQDKKAIEKSAKKEQKKLEKAKHRGNGKLKKAEKSKTGKIEKTEKKQTAKNDKKALKEKKEVHGKHQGKVSKPIKKDKHQKQAVDQ